MGEIKRGAILNYILLALQIGIPLALTPYIMESLGAAEYGVYMLASTIMVRLYMSDLGRTTTTKFLSEYLGKGDKEGAARFLGNITVLYGIIGAGILMLGLGIYPWLGDIFSSFSEEELRTYRVLYLLTLVNAAIMFPARSLAGVADARQRFTVPGIIAVASAATNGLGTVLLLWLGLRSTGLILLSIGTGIMALLCNMAYCFIGLRARICLRGWSSTICKGIFIFSFWMFLNQLINMLNAGTGNYIVAMTQGPTAAGVYTNGLMIYGHYFLLAGVLSALFLPRVVRMVVRGASAEQQTDAMVRLGRAQLMILGGALLVLLCYGREFFRLWIGHIPGADADTSYHICLCLIIPQTFALVQALGWQISQARDALRQRVLITGFNSLLFIIVSYFVCLHAGIRAQAVWAAASILIQLGMLNLIHYRGLGLQIWRFYRETFRRSLPCIITMGGMGMCLRHLLPANSPAMLAIGILLALLLYIPAVYYLYATAEERKLLRDLIPSRKA
ncbi:MAG: hypothetical protein IJA63_02525 [Akkermansia sp.]|nr:hypothetical protein [Akkermansia sp.]